METPIITEIPGDDPALATALAQAHLPILDLTQANRRFFRFDSGAGLVGFIGWESAGDIAMLRSLLVLPHHRSQGWGRAMIGWALLRLAEDGATDAYLLTTGIDRLAAKLGFAVIDRAQAPPPIRASRQFNSLCPSTALLMHRSLP